MFKLLGSSSSAHFELIILSSPHMIYSKGATLVLVNICSYSTCTQLMTPKDFSTMKVGIYIHQLDTSKNLRINLNIRNIGISVPIVPFDRNRYGDRILKSVKPQSFSETAAISEKHAGFVSTSLKLLGKTKEFASSRTCNK